MNKYWSKHRNERGGKIAADLVMAYRIRGGAHTTLLEDDQFELEALFVGLGSVLNKDSRAGRVVIQGFRIEGGLDEEAALLAEGCGVEAD